MEYLLRTTGPVQEIILSGSLDAKIPVQFEDELSALIERGERQMIFDFAAVDYVTSNGVRVLLRVFKQMTSVNGRIAFHSLSRRVRQVFEIAGLLMVFRVHETRAEALGNIGMTGMLPDLESMMKA